jgi:uracil-DNA glycosylase family 4
MGRHHPLAKCEDCELSKENTYVPTLFPQGEAELVVVGEAPGFYEVERQVPFTGPSGKLLYMVLAHTGISPKKVVKTNVCSCRPPNNATPSPNAIAACSERLNSDVSRTGTNTVLALGTTAASAILGDSRGVTLLRVGPPKPSRVPALEGRRVVATWHPAYCLRNADAFPSLVSDVAKVRLSDSNRWEAPAWHSYGDNDQVLEVLDAIDEITDRLVIDVEVGVEKDFSYAHPTQYGLLCVGIGYAPGKAVVIEEGPCGSVEVRDRLARLLKSKKIICHNGKFDMQALYPLLGDIPLWFDTMLAHYCIDERRGTHSLGELSIEMLGSPDWKRDIDKYVKGGQSYANVPRPTLYKYNAYDVANTWWLFEVLNKQLDQPVQWPYSDIPAKSLRDVHDFLVGTSDQLKFLELNGIAIDRKYSDGLVTDYLEDLEEIEARLDATIGRSINPRSPKQVKEYLASEHLHVASTNKDTLEQLQKRVDPGSSAGQFIDILLEHRRRQKLYSTYVVGIRKRSYRGRVYTTYLLHGTTSGRLSSRNPNLQNVVRDTKIRKQFAVSKPENLFIQADYKQAEGRVIAWLAQDEYLRNILADPTRDIFAEMGKDLYNKESLSKDERVRVKAYFYGLSYGREAYSIAMEYGIPVNEAERGLRAFKDLIPATEKWQQETRQKVLDGQDLISPFGRHRRYTLITEQNRKDILNEALSFLPQSTASDICLGALVRLRPALRGLGFIRLTIHDALVVECAEANYEQVSSLLTSVMVEEASRLTNYVPFAVDVSSGTNWGDL